MQSKHKGFATHVALLIGVVLILFPIFVALITSTHHVQSLLTMPVPLTPGHAFYENYYNVLSGGVGSMGSVPVWQLLWRSLVMATIVAVGKVVLSTLSAFAIVYFRFKGKGLCFLLIFLTLMLPVEVRIVPTFMVVARLDLLNSYAGLTLPLLASATATFLFRQWFMSMPDELTEAAIIDGAGPLRFFWDILLPLSKSNIVAVFIIMFIYGWNQYLWPLVVTTQSQMSTIVMGIQKLANVSDQLPQWNLIMATAVLALLPPVIVVVLLQRYVVQGLIETEK